MRCCYSAQRFFLLDHTMYDGRPQVNGNTIVRMFRPRSSARKREEGYSFERVHLPPAGVAPSDTVFQTGQGRGKKLAKAYSTPVGSGRVFMQFSSKSRTYVLYTLITPHCARS